MQSPPLFFSKLLRLYLRHILKFRINHIVVLAPGGIAVEYGYDGLLIDWENYVPTVSVEGDLWGHEYHFPGVND